MSLKDGQDARPHRIILSFGHYLENRHRSPTLARAERQIFFMKSRDLDLFNDFKV